MKLHARPSQACLTSFITNFQTIHKLPSHLNSGARPAVLHDQHRSCTHRVRTSGSGQAYSSANDSDSWVYGHQSLDQGSPGVLEMTATSSSADETGVFLHDQLWLHSSDPARADRSGTEARNAEVPSGEAPTEAEESTNEQKMEPRDLSHADTVLDSFAVGGKALLRPTVKVKTNRTKVSQVGQELIFAACRDLFKDGAILQRLVGFSVCNVAYVNTFARPKD